MDSSPIVSVIVAAYNSEKYLGRCLDSILAQTMEKWECIVVDDGSTDQTGVIAEQYASKDPRFRVIHQTNAGVARARQTGLDAARGTYMIHADSDDWVDADMLETMVYTANKDNADMVFCDFIFIHPGGFVEYRSQRPKSLESLSLLGEMMFDLHGSLCNKLIRRSLIEEYGLRFIEGMNIAEDQYLVFRVLAHNISVSHISRAFYHYDHTQNDESLCNSGVLASDRLKPLEMIASYTDISPVQEDFDKAVFHLAYEYLFEPVSLCPHYRSVFGKHWKAIARAKGFPFYTKVLIFLRIQGIRLPLSAMKGFWKKFAGRTDVRP